MKEQKYILKNVDSFELKDIFECGQCFRWNEEDDFSYTGVVGKNVINVKKIGNEIIFLGMCEDNIEDLVFNYFDLNRDYSSIKEQLSRY